MSKKWLSGPGEWLAAVGVLLSVVPIFLQPFTERVHGLDKILGAIGLTLFLGGVVVSISDIRKRSEESEKEIAQIKALTLGIEQTSNVALSFGTTLSALLQILTDVERRDAQQLLHVRAGEKLLRKHIFDFIPRLVKQLMGLRENESKFPLREPYFINDLLTILTKELGELDLQGSIWLGVTHLSEGWLEDKADPGYYNFVEGMRHLSSKGLLGVLRIYCLDGSPQSEKMTEHLARETSFGVRVRIIKNRVGCPDMSMIWAPSPAGLFDKLAQSHSPTSLLREEHVTPICGLKFVTREGRSLDEVEICSPTSTDFESLQQDFDEAWAKAAPFCDMA